MPELATRLGHGLAKLLGINLKYRNETADEVPRGESIFSSHTADTYVEDEPHSLEWVRDSIPSGPQLFRYVRSLFPFTDWILSYNLQWLLGDLVAGITIGAVVVPQGMAYAVLAGLEPQYGLYTSFMGVLIYWFFATSKDITIGPVAVMSTLVGQIVTKAKVSNPEIPGHVIASALSLICGSFILFIGLVRCGWIVELIPLVSIAAFMTGSALNIAVGQIPSLLGISGFDTRSATYKVFINSLKGIPKIKLDAAIGLTALVLLYLLRSIFTYGAAKFPLRKKTFFFLSTLRTAFVILLYTMVSWLVNRNHREKPLFKIVSNVPRGFTAGHIPVVNGTILGIFAGDIPAAVIVLLIEHIAIAKSFGRVNNYIINPSQEMVAIGATNILGPFLGAYPATGSFSRTAIKSKANVRTPFAGVITALVVLLAIYTLTAVFFYIPSAALSAVIIHAVLDLINPPNITYQFWRVSPFEVPIFFAGVFVTIFSSIENGIYTTIIASFILLMFRMMRARGRFLGRVKIHTISVDGIIGDEGKLPTLIDNGTFKYSANHGSDDALSRHVFLPLNHSDGSNPDVEVVAPLLGIFIYRFSEGFNYPNANNYLDQLTNHIFATTRRTDPDFYARPGDHPWNDAALRHRYGASHTQAAVAPLPTLKAIILDFSSVNHVDITSIQQLIDVRNQLDRYASPGVVDWHFTSIGNRWTKRALVAAGFGYPSIAESGATHRWKPIFSITEIGGSESAAQAAEWRLNEKRVERASANVDHSINVDSDDGRSSPDQKAPISRFSGKTGAYERRIALVNGLNRPLFHLDLTSALQSAVMNLRAREEVELRGGNSVGALP